VRHRTSYDAKCSLLPVIATAAALSSCR